MLYAKNIQHLEEIGPPAPVNGQRPALSPTKRAVTLGRPTQRMAITCTAATAVCVCVRTRVQACVRACVSACVRDVFAIYDNNI